MEKKVAFMEKSFIIMKEKFNRSRIPVLFNNTVYDGAKFKPNAHISLTPNFWTNSSILYFYIKNNMELGLIEYKI